MKNLDRASIGDGLSAKNYALVQRAAFNPFASEEVNLHALKSLRDQGANVDAVQDRCGPICRRLARFEGGTFELDEDLGQSAFILAVHATDAERVIDLLGWPIFEPDLFATYFGFAGVLGGDMALNPASFYIEPCPIWQNPLDWLRSDLKGCVILDTGLAAPLLRHAPGQFQCAGAHHAKWLIETGTIAADRLLVPATRSAA
jgi:hypothetical protein